MMVLVVIHGSCLPPGCSTIPPKYPCSFVQPCTLETDEDNRMRVCAFWRLSLFVFVVLFLASLGLLSFHNALIDARRASLVVQGDAIAALLAADASFEPERMAPLLRRLAPGPRIRARVFARDGVLLVDTVHRVGRVSPSRGIWSMAHDWWMRGQILADRLAGTSNSLDLDEALRGHAIPVRLTVEDGEPIVSVAVPIRRSGVALAVLLLSTPAGA
jgi:hypothetical protein